MTKYIHFEYILCEFWWQVGELLLWERDGKSVLLGPTVWLGVVQGVCPQGACSTCPSSTNTLKGGIERMLMHWVPAAGPTLGTPKAVTRITTIFADSAFFKLPFAFKSYFLMPFDFVPRGTNSKGCYVYKLRNTEPDHTFGASLPEGFYGGKPYDAMLF